MLRKHTTIRIQKLKDGRSGGRNIQDGLGLYERCGSIPNILDGDLTLLNENLSFRSRGINLSIPKLLRCYTRRSKEDICTLHGFLERPHITQRKFVVNHLDVIDYHL